MPAEGMMMNAASRDEADYYEQRSTANTGPVHRETDRIAEQLQKLDASLTELMERLTPVLHPGHPEADMKRGELAKEMTSGLASRLSDIADHAVNLTEAVQAIMRRVEV